MKRLHLLTTIVALIIATAFFSIDTQAQNFPSEPDALSKNLPFMTRFTPKSAFITDFENKDAIPSSFGLVRLPNDKVICMTRQNGKMEPFYIKAIETGYWDVHHEPDKDYDRVFGDMREMGANTAYVMIHWEEFETSDNNFDFSHADGIVAAAQRQGLKINWILFLHAQKNGAPSFTTENCWTYHIDDRDSCNYAMQWPKVKGVVCKDIKTLLDNGGFRPLHLYGHPEVFSRIRRMLYNVARHYRDSETVIGVQLGNEEGFSFLDESDFNPMTAAMFEDWKLKTNKSDYAQFKAEAMNWWWRQFTSAYHEGDPYKFLSFNLDAGQAEAGDPKRVAMTGTSASTYADGNLDAIGTMFYKHWGYKAIKALDNRYNEGSYSYQLPLYIPSEIGIGGFNSARNFNAFAMHTIERGSQGFGVYCYGDVRKELKDHSARQVLIDMFNNIAFNEKLVTCGLPGPGSFQCSIEHPTLQLSHLNYQNATLAMIYRPNFILADVPVDSTVTDMTVSIKAKEKGKYTITAYKDGQEILQTRMKFKDGEMKEIVLPQICEEDVIFVSFSL